MRNLMCVVALLLPLGCGDSAEPGPADNPAGASGQGGSGPGGAGGEAGAGQAGTGGTSAAGAGQGGAGAGAGGSAGAGAGGAGAGGAGAGGTSGSSGQSPGGSGGASGAGAGGAAGGGGAGGGAVEPIQAPPDTWTWVPVAGSRCASGTETGFGVRLRPGSKRLLIYMEGGGSCQTAQSCWISPTAANTSGFGEEDFKKEPKLKTLPILLDNQANPFADANQIFIPYCTGDYHGGTKSQILDVQGTPKETFFWGGTNMGLFLPLLAATFPGMDRVWLTGTSAGAAGTVLNFHRVKKALGSRVDTLNDSGPPFASGLTEEEKNFWGYLPVEGCPECATGLQLHAFNRSLDPSSRFGQLSFAYDPTIAKQTPLPEFKQQLESFVEDNKSDPGFFSFIALNELPKNKAEADHVVLTSVAPGAFAKALADWMAAFAKDGDPGQVTQPYP